MMFTVHTLYMTLLDDGKGNGMTKAMLKKVAMWMGFILSFQFHFFSVMGNGCLPLYFLLTKSTASFR